MDGNLVITTATKLTPNQHPKDRFFNPFRSPKSTGAKELVEDVLIQLQNYESHFKLRRNNNINREVFFAK